VAQPPRWGPTSRQSRSAYADSGIGAATLVTETIRERPTESSSGETATVRDAWGLTGPSESEYGESYARLDRRRRPRNTDFGETEVDERQISLDRFSLLFPEKRAFFLEDTGVFAFASTGPEPPGGIPPARADVFPFFSRRIGLLNGEEVPLDVGAKLTGKIGRSDVGVLAVRTGELADVVDPQNLMVARMKWNFFEQSYAGAIFTGGDPASDRSAWTCG
jgi:hypothetical protein